MNRVQNPIPVMSRMRCLSHSVGFAKNPIPYLNQGLSEFGDTYKMYLGGIVEGIITVNPAIIQHVLQKNHRNYKKSKLATETVAKYVGNGLLTSDGDYWLRQRRLIQPGFHKAKLAALVNTMNQETDYLLKDLGDTIKDQPIQIIDHWMMKLAFNIVAKTLFTTSMRDSDIHQLAHNITSLQDFIVKEVRQPYLKPLFYLNGSYKKYQNIANASGQLILDVIKKRKKETTQYDDLLDMLISARYKDTNEGMTDRQLLEESLILFLAGHETTANALSWMVYSVAQQDGVLNRLLNEIETIVGAGPILFEHLPHLTYTKQIIYETMRMYPPAWITDRIAKDDDHVEGISIKKGDLMVVYIYGAHHNATIWKDPETFNPDRFYNYVHQGSPVTGYYPFGSGPRFCIGNNFAMMEMQIALIKMFQTFRFDIVKDHIVSPKPLVTLRPIDGIKLSVQCA